MRGLAQALLLLAPVLVGAAPYRIGMEKADQHNSPSAFVTFDIPPGFNEDQPKPYTLRLQVLEAPSPCTYPSIKVNDIPLSQGGHTLGRGTFAGDHDGTTFTASWASACAGDEQLLRFTLESLAGRSLGSDLAFVVLFRQTAPAAIINVVGDIRLSDRRPLPGAKALPEFDHRDPRPGDDEDGLLENPPFPPPPHHRVGDHPDNHPGDHRDGDHRHRPSGRPASPEHDEHVLAELRELNCLRHQLHALKHAIREKEFRLALDHGVVPHRGGGRHLAFKKCDSLKCLVETLMRRVGGVGGFRRKGEGRRHGGPGREHGNHANGTQTLPPPPPPPGFCHCAPPSPEGPPEGPPEPPKGPHRGHLEGSPPPSFDDPHRGPPGPPGAPLPGPPPDFEHEHPLGAEGSQHRRPHPHGAHPHHGPPSPPHDPRVPLPMKIAAAFFFLVGILALLHTAVSCRDAARPERKHPRRARRRRDHREARNEAFKASLANLWSRMFADRLGPGAGFDDEEKRAFLSGGTADRPSSPSLSSPDEGDFETVESMTSEIAEFRNTATLVTEMVAAEERRQRMMREPRQDQERQQRLQMPVRGGPGAAVSPPSPTAAFAEYTGDDVLPAYDENAPSVIVSDGFSSYSPGSTGYVPGASSDATSSNIDSVLGDPKN